MECRVVSGEQLVQSVARCSSLETSLHSQESKLLPFQFKISKLEQEKSMVEDHQAWLEKELAAKREEVRRTARLME